MKIRHFFITLFFLLSIQFAAGAQFLAGAGISYGTEVEAVGLQPRVIYTISGPWRAGADFNYYLDGEDYTSFWDLNLNGQYVFHDTESLKAYALAGLNFLRFKGDIFGFGDATDTNIGLNIGAGVQAPVGPLQGLAEVRYVLGDFDQLVISATLLYAFGAK